MLSTLISIACSGEKKYCLILGINKSLLVSFSLLSQTHSGRLPRQSKEGFVLNRGLILGLKC